jgi:hypothetical protein
MPNSFRNLFVIIFVAAPESITVCISCPFIIKSLLTAVVLLFSISLLSRI